MHLMLHHPPVEHGPDEQPAEPQHRILRSPLGKGEDLRRKGVPDIEIDIAVAEPVQHIPARINDDELVEGLQYQSAEQDNPDRHIPHQPCHDIEDQQHVDKPQRIGRLDKAHQPYFGKIERAGCEGAELKNAQLQGHPQCIEIDEVDDLAVDIVCNRTMYAAAEEEARNQEEIRNSERIGKLHNGVHPALPVQQIFHIVHRMQHHHKNDADALGVIYPADPVFHFPPPKAAHTRASQPLFAAFQPH